MKQDLVFMVSKLVHLRELLSAILYSAEQSAEFSGCLCLKDAREALTRCVYAFNDLMHKYNLEEDQGARAFIEAEEAKAKEVIREREEWLQEHDNFFQGELTRM
jgi:hypothetical protein